MTPRDNTLTDDQINKIINDAVDNAAATSKIPSRLPIAKKPKPRK